MPKELVFFVTIKDCKVEAIASTQGGGGQNKNRRHTAIRITHPPSGAVGFSADQRDQLVNKRVAFRRMAESKEFQTWVKTEIAERAMLAKTGKTIDEIVDESMEPVNLRVEVKNSEGKWEELIEKNS